MRSTLRAFFERLFRAATCLGFTLPGIGVALAQDKPAPEEFPMRIQGDVGAGAYYTGSIVRGKSESGYVLPYGYFDYGRAFMRIDTLGIKTVKMGYGHLELVGRVSFDGFKADTASLRGLSDRKDPVPLGIGTFQETPVGAFFVNAFRDANKSKGNIFEAMYVGEIRMPRVTIYPQAGAEYLSRRYTGYFYGISAPESAASGYRAYQPGGAFNPFIAALVDTTLSEDVHLNFYLRHKWLAGSVTDSPIVGRNGMDTVFVSLAYRFK